jgi:hypothetical protein
MWWHFSNPNAEGPHRLRAAGITRMGYGFAGPWGLNDLAFRVRLPLCFPSGTGRRTLLQIPSYL